MDASLTANLPQSLSPIPWPGVPVEAAGLAEALSLVQDLGTTEGPLGPLELMGQALAALGGYNTQSDTADDVTYRTFFMPRFSGFSSQRIADQVKHMAGDGMDGVATPDEFIPIDAKAPGLKRPSKVLKKFLLCVVRMAKKPLSVVRDIKKVMLFPSFFLCGLA